MATFEDFYEVRLNFEPVTGAATLIRSGALGENRHADATPDSRTRRRRPEGLPGMVAKDDGGLCCFGSVLRRCCCSWAND